MATHGFSNEAAAGGEQLLAPAEVSRWLRIPVGTLYRWRSNGSGPPAIRVGRHLRYRASDLRAWLEDRER